MRYLTVLVLVVLAGVSSRVQHATASMTMPIPISAAADVAMDADDPDAELARMRDHIQALLNKPQPELFARHLRSVLALCEENVLKLHFAGDNQNDQAKELSGYLKVIETGLNSDGDRSETYFVDGKRALTLARLSRSDGTLQFYTVSLPPHWDPHKAYPLYVQLHGRGPDIPLAYVQDTFLPHDKDEWKSDDVIVVVPWLRGNGEWREENGSEPDIWEAIDDVKGFAKLDADRWYISGHSWGGDDVWAIVQRTPDLWAAAGIMAGNPGSAPSELGLLPNAKYVPFYLWRGDQDPIANRKTSFEYFRDALTAVGDPPKLVVAQGIGHMYRPQDVAELQSWLLEHVRRRPSHFSFVVDTPQHHGIWGISIPQKYSLAYSNVEPKVSFECWIVGSIVRIQTSDATKLDVDLGPNGLSIPGTVTLIVNGKRMFTGTTPEKPLSLDL
jgi:pimeloyl-ACP methyl ester carboxylesterase